MCGLELLRHGCKNALAGAHRLGQPAEGSAALRVGQAVRAMMGGRGRGGLHSIRTCSHVQCTHWSVCSKHCGRESYCRNYYSRDGLSTNTALRQVINCGSGASGEVGRLSRRVEAGNKLGVLTTLPCARLHSLFQLMLNACQRRYKHRGCAYAEHAVLQWAVAVEERCANAHTPTTAR